MPKVNRQELLQELESVEPGLAKKEIVQQSSCFVFKDGHVITCNDEIACTHKSILDISGAVQSEKFLKFLRRLTEEEIEIIPKEEEIQIKGKRQRVYIRMEKEIFLPLDSVEPPKDWKRLHSDFIDAINMVQSCASTDASTTLLTFVHITGKWVEAADNHQAMRYKCKTGFARKTLLRQSSIKHIVSLGMTKFSETETWTHFKNDSGLVLSCRRFTDDYPDLSPFMVVNGEPTILPKGLTDVMEKAEFASSEIKDSNEVTIFLLPGEMRIKAQGITCRYSAERKIKYKGKSIKFLISPSLFGELVKQHNEVHISQEALKVDGGKFVYHTSLGDVSEKEKNKDE